MAHWPHVYLLILILLIWGAEKLFPKFVAKAEENTPNLSAPSSRANII